MWVSDLNEWLERFIGKHSTQMEVVASGVTQVLDGLGFSEPEMQGEDGRPRTTAHSLMRQITEGVSDLQLRASNQEALHHSMLLMVQKVNGEVERLAHEREALSESLNAAHFPRRYD